MTAGSPWGFLRNIHVVGIRWLGFIGKMSIPVTGHPGVPQDHSTSPMSILPGESAIRPDDGVDGGVPQESEADGHLFLLVGQQGGYKKRTPDFGYPF